MFLDSFANACLTWLTSLGVFVLIWEDVSQVEVPALYLGFV